MRAHAALGGAALGAYVLWPIPFLFLLLVGTAVVVMWRSNPLAVAALTFLLASFVGSRAVDGLNPPDPGQIDTWIVLTSDPRPLGGYGVRASAIAGAGRVSVTAHGAAAGRLDDLLAGDQVRVAGAITPIRGRDNWSRWRHEVGRITVNQVIDSASGSPVARGANRVRRILAGGADSLNRQQRALFLGMVIGDDRDQSPITADDFRAAGLGHLLVVSGQNVAFVLAIVTPALRGLRPGGRLLVLVVTLLLFAVLTRFEPSVLRAVAMAGIGVGGAALGQPVDGRRGLSLALAGLLVIDPFLLRVLAFQLSAAATAGIVWFSHPLANRLRGPRLFRIATATTVAAQLAVAPLLVITFGPMPLASLPANLLAGPVAGPVMIWGCTGGLVAGVLGGSVAEMIHWPTALMLDWIAAVAGVAGRGPQATLGAMSILVVAGALLIRGLSGKFVSTMSSFVLLAVVATSFLRAPQVGAGSQAAGPGITLVANEGRVVVELADPPWPQDVLERLRRSGVSHLDLIIATDGDAADAFAVLALRDRYGPVPVVAPPLHRVRDARSVPVGATAEIAGWQVTAIGTSEDWSHELRFTGSGGSPASPDG